MDSAIRMNILDGVRQVAQKANEMNGQQISADGVELSAHPYSALDHEPVQGRQYTLAEFEKMQSGQDFEDIDGNKYSGFRRPIGQWNCHHIVSYIIIGISKRRYTDEQLKQWKDANHKGVEIDGQKYTIYQATQLMRKLETEVRKQKDIANMAKTSGDDVLRREAQAKIRDIKKKYTEIAQAAGLKARREKMETSGNIQKAYDLKHKPICENVTTEYQEEATPGQGRISYSLGYTKKNHSAEIETAKWIHEKFGGDIELRVESNLQGVKTPDYSWNNKNWELKSVSSHTSADRGIREGLKQIALNPGGVILDFGDIEIIDEPLIDVISRRVLRGCGFSVDILLKDSAREIILRYKK